MLYHRTNRVQRPPIYRDEFVLIPGHVYSVPTANCLEGMDHRADIARGTVKCPPEDKGVTIVFVRRTNTEDKGVRIPRTKMGYYENSLTHAKRPWRRYHIAPRSLLFNLTVGFNYQNLITIRCPIHQEKKSSSLHGRAALRWHLLRYR